MSDPTIGVIVIRDDEEIRLPLRAEMSTIIIFGPMDGADTTTFPLNRPVKGYSNQTRFTGKMGENFVRDAVRGINDQLAPNQFSATIIVVRTAKSTANDPAVALRENIANIVGDSTAGTGLWAGLLATELVQSTPRLWLAPGFTSYLSNSLSEIERATAGSGYVAGQRYNLTLSGGGTGAIQGTAHAIGNSDGTLGLPVIDTYGAFYTEAPTVTAPAPGGSGVRATYTATAAQEANAICAALPPILAQFLAHAVVESAGTSQAGDEQFRETLSSDRLIPVVGGVKVLDPTSKEIVVRPYAPRVAGVMIRRDHETRGPFHSACNQPVYGVVGPARRLPFNITSGDNEGQSLLSIGMGILVAGEVANDFAIAQGGFICLATDNAGEDEVWRFYNQTRGRDYIHILCIRTTRYYLGKFNITIQTGTAIVNTIKNILRDLEIDGALLGSKTDFVANDNSAEKIRAGRIVVNFAAEEPAPLRVIEIHSSRYRPAVEATVVALQQQLSLAA